MKKLLASAFVLGLFTFACDRCPDVPRFFDIQDVLVENYTLEDNNGNQPGNFPDSARFEHFRIMGSYRVIHHAAAKPAFSLVSKAYALECVEPGSGGTNEKIESLELIALTDYNATYKKGASLNPVLKINGLPVAEYIQRQNAERIYQYGFEITLTQKPDTTVKQAFKLVYKLTNGETYTPETKPIRIY